GPVSRYLNRPVSTRISMTLAPLRISPDLASWFAAAVGIVAGWLLAVGYGLAGAIAAHACSVLDGVDGELARLQVRATARGAMLDGVLDRLATPRCWGDWGSGRFATQVCRRPPCLFSPSLLWRERCCR